MGAEGNGGRVYEKMGGSSERTETDHVTSGPMRGPEKNAPDGADKQTNGHGDSMTKSLNSVKTGSMV